MNTYHGTTRQEMERAGRALPKRQYACPKCLERYTHDRATIMYAGGSR